MRQFTFGVIGAIAGLVACAVAVAEEEPSAGTISGRVFELPSGVKAVVFLCDGDTGLPIRKPGAAAEGNDPEWDQFRIAVTDAEGNFEFDGLAVGKYRMFAQSWKAMDGLPEKLISRTQPEFTIHGVANDVRILDARAGSPPVRVEIRRLGNQSITLDPTPKEANAFLLISQGDTLGDPSGSIMVCGDDFLSKLCLFVCFHDPQAVVHGLPDDAQLTLTTFYYDNVPGAGGTRFQTTAEKASYFVYAGWSNGHKEPPRKLAPLVNALKNRADLRASLPELLGFTQEEASDVFRGVFRGKMRPQEAWDKLGGAQRMVKISGVGTYPVVDIVMAWNFTRL